MFQNWNVREKWDSSSVFGGGLKSDLEDFKWDAEFEKCRGNLLTSINRLIHRAGEFGFIFQEEFSE